MKRSILCLALLLTAATASAETAFQLGFGVRVPDDPHVDGLRLSILYGENESQEGVDLGFVSVSETGRMSGVGFILGVSHVTRGLDSGAVFSLINYHTGHDTGVNGAFVNILKDAVGFNTGFLILSEGKTGVDLGGLNVSKRSQVQIGFINVTDHIESFQFGFINAAENGMFPIFPVFNIPK